MQVEADTLEATPIARSLIDQTAGGPVGRSQIVTDVQRRLPTMPGIFVASEFEASLLLVVTEYLPRI